MAFHVRDKETDRLVRELARDRGVGLTEAVKLAVKSELARNETAVSRKLAAMKVISDEVASWPETGLKADKAFFDEMSGDDD
ncbi:MAG: type II toxin-antitoxin system VapB family antitoxin [Caulobacter sp.]|nr:type II toxin-antitoxin system VapB family antitoxin [Caulobacter sp.]